MGLTAKLNLRELEFTLNQIGERAQKGMAARMRTSAIKIRDLAREYAPEKTGLLADSIDYAAVQDGRRKAYVVFIDLGAGRLGGKAGQVGDYADIMEYQLRPFGNQGKPFHLGVGSLLKAAATGKRVGGRFLKRAVDEGLKNLMSELNDEVRRVVGGRTIPTNYQRLDRGGDE